MASSSNQHVGQSRHPGPCPSPAKSCNQLLGERRHDHRSRASPDYYWTESETPVAIKPGGRSRSHTVLGPDRVSRSLAPHRRDRSAVRPSAPSSGVDGSRLASLEPDTLCHNQLKGSENLIRATWESRSATLFRSGKLASGAAPSDPPET